MSIGSHHSSSSITNTWLTPPDILQKLGRFDLDPCSGPDMPWATADTMWGEEDDGLSPFNQWFGRVFCNPPYSRPLINGFMRRMSEHGHGTALVFARTETEWATNNVFKSSTASGVLFLEGRLHFHHIDGTRAKGNAGAPSMLVSYGAKDFEIIEAAGFKGTLLPLNRAACLYMFVSGLPQSLPSWRDLIIGLVQEMGGKVSLQDIYAKLDGHEKTKTNPNHRAKIRQTLARTCQRVGPSQYALAI